MNCTNFGRRWSSRRVVADVEPSEFSGKVADCLNKGGISDVPSQRFVVEGRACVFAPILSVS